MKKIVDWYVNKYWGKDYIAKEDISLLLVKVKEEEAEKWKIILEEEKEHAVELKEDELRMEIAEIQAECARLNNIIIEKRALSKAVERMMFENKKDAKKNFMVSNELKGRVTNLLTIITELQGRFDIIALSAEKQVKYLDTKNFEGGA